jgi:hypothetical protein
MQLHVIVVLIIKIPFVLLTVFGFNLKEGVYVY